MKRINLKNILLILFILIISGNVFGADPSISLTLDRTSASINDSIYITVSVKGKTFVSHPRLLGVENFSVRQAGSSSQMQIINGAVSSSKVFHYVLIPRKTGTFTIGPAVLDIGGQQYKSNTAIINIRGEEHGPQVAPTPNEERTAYMTARVNKSNPYVGEQIVYTANFYTRIAFQNAQLDVPEFTGFWKEQLGDVKNTQKVINGRLWQVSTVSFALFPLESGELTIEKTTLSGDFVVAAKRPSSLFSNPFFDSFYDTERKRFSSKPVKINVKPLPTEGKPADFSGLVGNFSVSEEISSRKLEAGESTTLTVTVKGDGDLKKLSSPEIKNGSFKIYDDKPIVKTMPTSSGLSETKIFKKAIVPLSPGQLTISSFKFSYFDPKKEEYIKIATSPIVLDVKPSSKPEQVIVSSGEGRGVVKKELEVLGRDLSPVVKNAAALENDVLTDRILIFYLVIGVIPILLFIAALAWHFRLQKLREDSGYIKRGKAFKKAQKSIKIIDKLSGSEFFTKASHILRDYIGDRLSIDGRSLTAADVSRRIEPMGVSNETCSNVREFLNNCDAGLYGGMTFTEEKKETMIYELKQIIKKLEKELKK